ncbi:hypothetical protein [Niabella drilacis]|uniref:Glycosyl transferase family 2 n=1 Tax=Niabella drilacis (strain DSM 25811 / CCM 8410 / CCUG 62505 / LMG 26954 / E90) TaxID=1285928 RepID=A0A1G7AZT3_NIADE|nr:hypothetical protein [Niabella drilacis]SDE20329.1 hypothetical protein SAMN04487894_12620 [Niabella drilacis]
MKIVGLTCTNGRFSHLERVVTCFLNQIAKEKHFVIFNNASIPITMKPHKDITLINNHIDYITMEPYKHLGSIYRDAFSHIPPDTDLVSLMDDDDFYLPGHFADSTSILNKQSEYNVWKPGRYFKKLGLEDVQLREADNDLEGSCVVRYNYLKKKGFSEQQSLEVHSCWYKSAVNEKCLFIDHTQAPPSYCCDLSHQNTIRISSLANHYEAGIEMIRLYEQKEKPANFGIGKNLTTWSDAKFNDFINFYFEVGSYI